MKLAIGCMTWGRETDEAECKRIFEFAYERGVRTFDTAAIYADGESERILGRIVKGVDRSTVTVMTKVGYRRPAMSEDIADSLDRLGVDTIDMCFDHSHGKHGSVDVIACHPDVYESGASNTSAWEIARRNSLEVSYQVAAIQPMYSLAKRQAEVELFPMAQAYGLDVYTYSPLASGLLASPRVKGTRLDVSERYSKRYNHQRSAPDFYRLAEGHGIAPSALALWWAGQHPAVTAPIVGARSLSQLKESMDALDIKHGYRSALYDACSALFPSPPPATDRCEEC